MIHQDKEKLKGSLLTSWSSYHTKDPIQLYTKRNLKCKCAHQNVILVEPSLESINN